MRGLLYTAKKQFFLEFDTEANRVVAEIRNYIPSWDMGDGTVLNLSKIDHTYAVEYQGGLIKRVRVSGSSSTVTAIVIGGCGIVGLVDLRNIKGSIAEIFAHSNPKLSQLVFPTVDYLLTTVFLNGNPGLLGKLDTRQLMKGSQQWNIKNTGITEILFATTTNAGKIDAQDCANLEILNIKFPLISLHALNSTKLKTLSFSLTTTAVDFLNVKNCPIEGALDLSPLEGGVTGDLLIENASKITSFNFPATAAPMGNRTYIVSPTVGTIDFKGCTISGTFVIAFGGTLQTFTISSLSNTLTNFHIYKTALNCRVGLGAKIIAKAIRLDENGMTLANVNGNIDDLYQNRTAWATVSNTLNISGIGNAAPSGTYQAPAGYVQGTTGVAPVDGTPASAREQIYVLVNQTNSDGTKKYSWTITTN